MSESELMGLPAARDRVRHLLNWNEPSKEEPVEGWGTDFFDYCVAVHEIGHVLMSVGEVRMEEANPDWERASQLFQSLMDRVHLERRLDEMEERFRISDRRWKRVIKLMKKFEVFMSCQSVGHTDPPWEAIRVPHQVGEEPERIRIPQPGIEKEIHRLREDSGSLTAE
jgi:hypothetical protein